MGASASNLHQSMAGSGAVNVMLSHLVLPTPKKVEKDESALIKGGVAEVGKKRSSRDREVHCARQKDSGALFAYEMLMSA